MTARVPVLLFALLLWAQADSLILKDGTRVTGRWWSVDAGDVHFLVNNQLQHYPRSDVSAVTFGDATPPPPPAAPSAKPSASVPPPAPAPSAKPSASVAPPAPAPSAKPSASVPPAAPAPASGRGPSEPAEIGVVYFRNGSGDLTPLERNQAVERRRGSTPYWEMPGPQSRVRVKAAPDLVFVVRLANGTDPAAFSLYPLVTVNGSRRTEPQPGRRGGAPVTRPYDVTKTRESAYTFTVRDLPTGEYSFSPSSSNDGYCFGVDPAAPGR